MSAAPCRKAFAKTTTAEVTTSGNEVDNKEMEETKALFSFNNLHLTGNVSGGKDK